MAKQYSIWNILPQNKEIFMTVGHRELLNNKKFLSLGCKMNISLFFFVSGLLLNYKNKTKLTTLTIKKSKMRNFIGKKIHSENKNILNDYISDFIVALTPLNLIHFKEEVEHITISFSPEYYNKMSSGNTVSFDLFSFTGLRGELAKMSFLTILSHDLRKKERFFNLNFIAKKLNLNTKNNRLTIITKIKRALKSLDRNNHIEFVRYNYTDLNSGLFKFIFNLKNLLQN